jgi:hypothetical protein
MPWTSSLLEASSALPVLIGFVVVTHVLIVAVAAMVAIWHPAASRRSAALKVLALMLRASKRRDLKDHDVS